MTGHYYAARDPRSWKMSGRLPETSLEDETYLSPAQHDGNIDMADEASEHSPLVIEEEDEGEVMRDKDHAGGEAKPLNSSTEAASLTVDPNNLHHLKRSILQLTAHLAARAADNAILQRKKAVLAKQHRDAHSRLTTTTQALTSLTNSYDKRLTEKNDVIAENAELQEQNARLRDENARLLGTINENTAKMQDLENRLEGLIVEKNSLKGKAAEKEELMYKIQELETAAAQTSSTRHERPRSRERGKGEVFHMGAPDLWRPDYENVGDAFQHTEDRHALPRDRARERDPYRRQSDDYRHREHDRVREYDQEDHWTNARRRSRAQEDTDCIQELHGQGDGVRDRTDPFKGGPRPPTGPSAGGRRRG